MLIYALAWIAIDMLVIIWKSDLSCKVKSNYYHVVAVSVLLYGWTTLTQTKQLEKNLKENHIRILRALKSLSWKQRPSKQPLYDYLLPISQTTQVRRIGHTKQHSESWDDLISDVLPWTPTHGHTSFDRPAKTCIHQLCADTGCSLEDI